MKHINKWLHTAFTSIALISVSAFADSSKTNIDDFSDSQKNSFGIERQFIDDTSGGGKTKAENTIANGILSAKGDIAPARGQPGWASAVLLLDPQGLPFDASSHEGVLIRIRIHKGNLSLSANSSEITNFDYHAAALAHKRDGEFHEIKIPFKSLKRTWSEQTPLNTKTIASLSLTAFSMQNDSYHFEVDQVRFY